MLKNYVSVKQKWVCVILTKTVHFMGIVMVIENQFIIPKRKSSKAIGFIVDCCL